MELEVPQKLLASTLVSLLSPALSSVSFPSPLSPLPSLSCCPLLSSPLFSSPLPSPLLSTILFSLVDMVDLATVFLFFTNFVSGFFVFCCRPRHTFHIVNGCSFMMLGLLEYPPSPKFKELPLLNVRGILYVLKLNSFLLKCKSSST